MTVLTVSPSEGQTQTEAEVFEVSQPEARAASQAEAGAASPPAEAVMQTDPEPV